MRGVIYKKKFTRYFSIKIYIHCIFFNYTSFALIRDGRSHLENVKFMLCLLNLDGYIWGGKSNEHLPQGVSCHLHRKNYLKKNRIKKTIEKKMCWILNTNLNY